MIYKVTEASISMQALMMMVRTRILIILFQPKRRKRRSPKRRRLMKEFVSLKMMFLRQRL